MVVSPDCDPGKDATERVIRSRTLWSICTGAVPVPLFDVAAVTAVQMDALKQLASIFLSVDRSPTLADHYSVRSLPTVVAVKNGKVVGRKAGSIDKRRLSAFV